MTTFASLVGRIVGPCRVESLLAEGGSGQVYRAQHERLQTPVALKVIAPRYGSNPRALQRFRREAQAAARLSHPAVARILDLGEIGGRPFIVHELVESEDLAARVARTGPLDTDAAVALALQLTGGLTAIHAAGLLHRDLKPANIIITDSGAKIVDFGLAKDLEADDDGPSVTRTGMLVGTPLYMAPEQVQGRELTPAADWYGLGGVLRFALTGRPPHGPDSGGGSMLEFLERRAREPVPPLQRDGVPDAFATLVDRLLAIDPTERPDSDVVRRALLALRRARRPTPAPPAAKPADIWPWVVGSLVVLVLATTVAYVLQPVAPAPRPPARPAPKPPVPEPPIPEPPPPEPPTPEAPASATLDDVLAQLGALDLAGARASLARLDPQTATEEAAAAREVLRCLHGLNADARLTHDWPPRPGTLDRAPKTRAVFLGLAQAGLPVYVQARLNLENGNPRGTRQALFNAPPNFGDAPFLVAERRPEISLLERVAKIAALLEAGRPAQARDDLADLLEHPSADTALGRRARPFLLSWGEMLDRAQRPR